MDITTGTNTPETRSASRAMGACAAGACSTRRMIRDTVVSSPTRPTPNVATLDEFTGAGILIRSGSPTILNCVITNNWAGCWGGAICCSWSGQGSPTIINCTISDNFCDDDGGAIFSLDSNPTIINSLIVNNEARVVGGGISDFGAGTVTIINSTITGNVAPTGAGIFGSTVTMTNSIAGGNLGNQGMSGAATGTRSQAWSSSAGCKEPGA